MLRRIVHFINPYCVTSNIFILTCMYDFISCFHKQVYASRLEYSGRFLRVLPRTWDSKLFLNVGKYVQRLHITESLTLEDLNCKNRHLAQVCSWRKLSSCQLMSAFCYMCTGMSNQPAVPPSSTLKVQKAQSSGVSLNFCQTSRNQIWKYNILHSNNLTNRKFHRFFYSCFVL
jgi:hypothetical protein